MPKTSVFFILMLMPVCVNGQLRVCRIISGNNGDPVANVTVTGTVANVIWMSDSLGMVQIPSDAAGPFKFSHLSYQTRILQRDTGVSSWIVALQPLPYTLDGVVVLSPMARFRRDSAFNHSFYRRELADAKFKPGKKFVFIQTPRGIELGIQWGGMLSNLAMVATGKKTLYKKFARNLKRFESEKFAAIRYTPDLVSEQTGLEEDSAYAFIASHPLDDEFLRNATEIELKMRIREMYRSKR